MDQITPRPAPQSLPPSQIVTLRCRDHLPFDPALLARVMAGKSLFEAEDMLCRILESMAVWIDALHDGLARDSPDHCAKAARRITLVASQIGLSGLAVAAGHVGHCARARDAVALAATLGRLERAFDLAVMQVWHIRDH